MQPQETLENILSTIERSFSVKNIFLFGSMLATIVLTILFYFKVLPLSFEYFLFYSFILFLACLARPSWMFLFFVALLPLEIVSVTPIELGFDLRPYQWVGGLLGMALAVRLLAGRLPQPLFRWHPVDTLLIIFVGGVMLSGIVSQGVAVKQAIVVGSFLFLYFLSRIFLRTWEDVKLALLFFLVSGSLSLLWGIGQNILFLAGKLTNASLGYGEFSIMPGRPNGTLIEPDWLGFFSLFLLAPALLWLKQRLTNGFGLRTIWLPFTLLLLILTTLVLTVSRSAWLGALALIGVFSWLAFYTKAKHFAFRPALLFSQCLVVIFGLSLLLVEAVPLTRFPLIDRAESTLSHLQEITIACDGTVAPPKEIQTTDELAQYGCLHILLEEKMAYQNEGKLVTTTFRPDPNVNIRKMIYGTAWENIKNHPVLGIGWGNIGERLGVDERGASYNASNLWLEVWLGGGLIAVGAFVYLCGWILFQTVVRWIKDQLIEPAVPMIALFFGFIIFNLFNTGLLLGFVWVWFALFPLLFPQALKEDKNTVK